MLYALATCRQNAFNTERLAIAQRAMVRRMLKVKRQPAPGGGLEPWVDWQIRSLGLAKDTVRKYSVSISVALAKERAVGRTCCKDWGW